VHDRQHDLVEGNSERPRQRREIRPVRGGIEPAGEHDRVVAPHGCARPEATAHFMQLHHRRVRRDDRILQRARIAGHGELHDERRRLPPMAPGRSDT
jgi:hypothetical protein